MNLGHQCALWIYRVVKLPKDFLITQWKWLLRPNVPIAVHGRNPGKAVCPEASTLDGVLFHEKLAAVVVEAGKTYSLLSTCWKPRKASGIIQLESESLRVRGLMSDSRKDGYPSSRRERENLPFLHPGP